MGGFIDLYSTTLAVVRGSTQFSPGDRFLSGGRILLPQRCLSEISRLTMVYPLQFKISVKPSPHRAETLEKHVYAAVLEFTAERGIVVLPDWMADHLGLPPASFSSASRTTFVELQTCNLGGANRIKLQPHSSKFISLSDPREILERQLCNYPVLTAGTSIIVRHAMTDFFIRIISLLDHRGEEVEAVLSARADLKATEVKVEFEPPMDALENEEEEVEEVLWAPRAARCDISRGSIPCITNISSSGAGSSPGEKNVAGSSSSISFTYPANFQPPSIDSLRSRDSRYSGKSGETPEVSSSVGQGKETNRSGMPSPSISNHSTGTDPVPSFTPFAGHGRAISCTAPSTSIASSPSSGNCNDSEENISRLNENGATNSGASSFGSASSNVLTPEQMRAARLKWLKHQSR